MLQHVARLAGQPRAAGHPDLDLQGLDAARRSLHVLLHRNLGAVERPTAFLGADAHQGQHARAERRCDQVGRRERLAAAFVVDGSVRHHLRPGWPVFRAAAQLPEVRDFDLNHCLSVPEHRKRSGPSTESLSQHRSDHSRLARLVGS
jgi:hypothetical protein